MSLINTFTFLLGMSLPLIIRAISWVPAHMRPVLPMTPRRDRSFELKVGIFLAAGSVLSVFLAMSQDPKLLSFAIFALGGSLSIVIWSLLGLFESRKRAAGCL